MLSNSISNFQSFSQSNFQSIELSVYRSLSLSNSQPIELYLVDELLPLQHIVSELRTPKWKSCLHKTIELKVASNCCFDDDVLLVANVISYQNRKKINFFETFLFYISTVNEEPSLRMTVLIEFYWVSLNFIECRRGKPAKRWRNPFWLNKSDASEDCSIVSLDFQVERFFFFFWA